MVLAGSGGCVCGFPVFADGRVDQTELRPQMPNLIGVVRRGSPGANKNGGCTKG